LVGGEKEDDQISFELLAILPAKIPSRSLFPGRILILKKIKPEPQTLSFNSLLAGNEVQ
jgi:hypothetical protein